MSFEQNLEKILERHKDVGEKLVNPDKLSKDEFVNLSKEFSDLEPIVEKVNFFLQKQRELKELEEMLKDPSLDGDMKDIAEEEMYSLKKAMPELERAMKITLLPKDKDDEKNAILEIRAGTGGDEAALFGSVLFRMYQRYAENRGWRFELL